MSHMNLSIGEVERFSENENGLFGSAGESKFEVSVYSESIVRVRLTRNQEFSGNPYSVILEPDSDQHVVAINGESAVVKTEKLTCEVQNSPFRVTFKNAEGDLLNEDEPAFGTSWIGTSVTTYKTLHKDEIFLGLGEKVGGINRRGQSFTNWNTDKFGYSTDADPLYLSTPFYIGILEGRPYGIFFDNTHKTHFNFGTSNNERFTSFGADDGDMDYYFIHGDNVAEVIENYSELTGKMELPPLWSLGFQQCRYSYYPDSEVRTVAKTFRDKKIPADVIYLDIHYMDEYKAFTFDNERFPEPAKLIEELEDQGFKVVVILDPGLKTEDGYGPYERGLKEDIFIKYPDDSNFEASVWPGNSHFPDFTAEAGREFWKRELKYYTDLGIKGFWNDMNEPACWGQSIPDLVEFDYDGKKTTHREARNVYGMNMVRSTLEGAKEQIGNERPFTLTRAGFSGIQRYAAVWTGDNVDSTEHMMLGVRLVNSLGLTGVPFSGYDVGGFAGDGSTSLFAKWIGIGAFAPFFRAHSMVNSRDSEPWAFGEEVEEISRNYINLRYKLLPYLYSVFYEASQTGMPVNRSLAIEYYRDKNIYKNEFENQFTCGPAILVAPTETQQKYSKVYLPEGNWFDFFTDEKEPGQRAVIVETELEDLPVYIKAGSIIPMQSVIQSTVEQPDSTLNIHIYHTYGQNSFQYYEDDGKSYDYQQGAFFKKDITLDGSAMSLILDAAKGNFESKFNKAKIYFHGFQKNLELRVNGQSAITSLEDFRSIDPITEFDPKPDRAKKTLTIESIPIIEVDWDSNKTSITW